METHSMDMNQVYDRVYGRDEATEEECHCPYCSEQRMMANDVKSSFTSPDSFASADWIGLTKVTLAVHERTMSEIIFDNRPSASMERFSCRMAYFSLVLIAMFGLSSSVASACETTTRLAVVVRDKWYEALDLLQTKSFFLSQCPCLVRDYLLFEQRLTSWLASFAHACVHDHDFVDPVNRRGREFQALVERSV